LLILSIQKVGFLGRECKRDPKGTNLKFQRKPNSQNNSVVLLVKQKSRHTFDGKIYIALKRNLNQFESRRGRKRWESRDFWNKIKGKKLLKKSKRTVEETPRFLD